MTSLRTDEKLWQRVKASVQRGATGGPAGTWNARKAQYAVKKYKDAGGKYRGPKRGDNSLVKWTKEKWGYVDGKPGNRYLPETVRRSLTAAEKATENRRKRAATRQGLPRAKYSASVLAKMRKR